MWHILVVELNVTSCFFLIFKQPYYSPVKIRIAESPIDIGPCTCGSHTKACLISVICQMLAKKKKVNRRTYLYCNIRNSLRSHHCQAAQRGISLFPPVSTRWLKSSWRALKQMLCNLEETVSKISGRFVSEIPLSSYVLEGHCVRCRSRHKHDRQEIRSLGAFGL